MDVKKNDVIIVGAGIGGLTSAVFLARAGKRVLLIEKNDEVGGLVNSFERNGFVFDAGARGLLDAGLLHTLIKELELEVELLKSDVSVGIENQIMHVNGLESINEYRELLLKLYPESKEDIDKIIKVMLETTKLRNVMYGIENPLFKDVKRDFNYLMKLLAWLPGYIVSMIKMEKYSKPVEDLLASLTRNRSLIDIIAQHFFKRTPSSFALSYFALYSTYYYPSGGTGSFPRALARKIEEYGGEILKNTSVTEIYADEKLVLDDKGNKYFYKNLIWGADLKTFYKITRVDKLEKDFRNKFEEKKERVLKAKPSESVFTLYLGVDLPPSYFAKIHHGHFFFTPYKNGLGDIHKGELQRLLDNWDSVNKELLYSWLDPFVRFNTFEISIPSLRDPGLSPEGKTGLIVSLLMEYELFEKLEKSGLYEEFRKELEDKMIGVLSETIYPELKDKIELSFSFSPISIQKRVGTSGGAIVGWAYEGDIPAVTKMQLVNKSVSTTLPNIYQVGQWAYSPAGVPTSIITGKIAADKVLKDLSS